MESISFLGNPYIVGPVFSLMIVMSVFIGLRVWTWRNRADQLSETLRRVGKFSDSGWDEDVRDELKEKVKETGWLEEPFHEWWEQTWVEADEGRLMNSIQSGEFLEKDSLAPARWAFADAFPGLLTAAGILGTFLGIVVGLAGLDLTVEQSRELQHQIGDLVNGLQSAFWTSILGLSLNMLATFWLKRAVSRFDGARVEFIRKLDALVDRVTPQDLLGLLVRHHARAAEKAETMAQNAFVLQSKSLEQLEIIAKFLGEVDEGVVHLIDGQKQLNTYADEGRTELRQLNHDLGDVMERTIQNSGLVEAVQNMAETIASTQTEGVGKIVEQFSDQMGAHFGESFGALGDSIDAMVGANSEYRDSMGGVVQHLQAGMETQKEAAAAMGGTVNEARSAVAEMATVLESLRTSVSALDSTAGGARDMLQAQTDQTERVLVALTRQKDVWGEQLESLQSLRDAVDSLRDWHQRVKDELGAQLNSWRDSLQVQAGLTDDVRRERESTAALVDSLQNSASAFSSVSTMLGHASSSLEGHLETTGSTNQAAAEELVRASAGLGELRSALEGSITAFKSTAEALAVSGPQVATALQGLQQAVQGQAQVVEQGEKLAAAMSLSVGRQERLADAFGAAAEMTERVKPAAAQLGQAAVNLEQSTRTLAASLQAMRAVASQLEGRDKEASQTWNRVTNEMQSTTTALTDGMGAYSKQMNDLIRRTLEEFDREMARATKELQRAVTSLHAIVNDLADFTEGMQS